MNIAIIHFHLQRGGVAQIIRHHCQALAGLPESQRPRVAVLTSGRETGWTQPLAEVVTGLDLSLVALPSLDYDGAQVSDAPTVVDTIADILASLGFATDNTVIHVHNHQLGKNVALPIVCRMLAERGFALLLQIHDFPEDFRPDRYRVIAAAAAEAGRGVEEYAYPQGPHIQYAALNTRDAAILVDSGIDAARVHLLPNPVAAIPLPEDRDMLRRRLESELGVPTDTRFVLYPVRGIRRKNLGEFLLWSILTGDAVALATTLPPLNPIEQPSYQHWKRLAASLRLSCYFEWGLKPHWNFPMWLAAADYILTTSVAEGFGMVYLESWLAGRQLLGRDLPEITPMFRHAGMDLQGLSPHMLVPSEWIDWDAYRRLATAYYERVLMSYGRSAAPGEMEQVLDERAAATGIDFAFLPGTLQHQVIVQCASSPAARAALAERNPQVRQVLAAPDEQLIEKNAAVIRSQFSLGQCGQQLAVLYRRALDSERGAITGPSGGTSVLDAFLSFSRFHPLRVETWTEA